MNGWGIDPVVLGVLFQLQISGLESLRDASKGALEVCVGVGKESFGPGS